MFVLSLTVILGLKLTNSFLQLRLFLKVFRLFIQSFTWGFLIGLLINSGSFLFSSKFSLEFSSIFISSKSFKGFLSNSFWIFSEGSTWGMDIFLYVYLI